MPIPLFIMLAKLSPKEPSSFKIALGIAVSRVLRQTVKRSEEAAISCRGPEIAMLLKRCIEKLLASDEAMENPQRPLVETVAKISVLERQRDELEAELKKKKKGGLHCFQQNLVGDERKRIAQPHHLFQKVLSNNCTVVSVV
ncbi:hypothetical protein V6N13_091917 [Hibiscus sabdariffa]|uniref:Uncharacterized protein n=1 Tax=Hibiscus sabdariffa TaxID=183260 RepID=A0ABR2QFE5_9ROSI